MAFQLIQAGSSLQFVDESGVLTTLTLPTGITLKTDRPPRFALYGRYVVMVNTPNRPISIDPFGEVRVLVPFPPSTALGFTATTAGDLTGTYKAKQTYIIRDRFGNVLAESDFGPAQASGEVVVSKTLALTGINISADDISGSNIYRTLDGGEVYFKWRELDGNILTTSDEDDLADLELEIFSAPILGTPPDLSLIAEWRGRLWGISRVDVDTLRYTEPGTMFAWSTNNAISIPKIGADTRGVTAIITRRDSLVVGRRNSIQQITGTSNNDFRCVKLTDQCGIESNESIAIYKDSAFFIWKDGVYRLDANGVECISDGKVRSWFTTDTYFNRARFQYAAGAIDPVQLKYRLYLSAPASTDLDRWIEYDLVDGTWWGPHKTDAFTPVSSMTIATSDDILLPVVASSSGFLWKEQATATDNVSTGIDFNVDTAFDSQDTPDMDKFWGQLSIVGKPQTTGNLTITPYIGYTNAAAANAFYFVMSKGKQLLGRLGIGKMVKFNFRHTAAAEPVELYGYEVDNVHELGQR